jgi:hypothetical protein
VQRRDCAAFLEKPWKLENWSSVVSNRSCREEIVQHSGGAMEARKLVIGCFKQMMQRRDCAAFWRSHGSSKTGHRLFQTDHAEKRLCSILEKPWKRENWSLVVSNRTCRESIVQHSVGAMEAPSCADHNLFYRSERPPQMMQKSLQHSVGAMEAPSCANHNLFYRSERPTQMMQKSLQHSVGAMEAPSCADHHQFHGFDRPTQIMQIKIAA